MTETEVVIAHSELSPDVRDRFWVSNCAGEIFLFEEGENGLRIGHFQGDASLAAFVVKAHNAILSSPSSARQTRS
ncbi:hypothetical protein [Burkholderia ubonensis]|uniref:hypothetical protein n=1 Tax=Burkholderia ubonensis TaxID=101571 RepID=UPI0012F7CB8D|nr:hypothetical protein [Burkholderia ubonensis]